MNITRVSFTGADNKINPEELMKVSLDYPIVEWAILFSQNKEGSQRYPTKDWRERFYASVPNVYRAAHLCGSPMLTAFATADENLKKELENYQRVQLNFNSKHLKDHILQGLITHVKNQTFKYMGEYPIEVITQHNHSNATIHELFKAPNHAVLFDASGGHGVALDVMPEPIPGFKCGFAGGISPENVESILYKLKETVGSASIWIDMESGVRTDNEFDIGKVKEVVAAVKSFVVAEHNKTYNTDLNM